MRKRNEKGFTLIEVVVVVAVIAILAAVLTPYITKYIDDSKIAKARNEVQVIAAAVTNAYKDPGRWPNQIAVGNPANYAGLHTGAAAQTAAAVALIGGAAGWDTTAANWSPLDTHLVTNNHGYLATGDTRWAGPYATALPLDPWGRPYVVNAANFTSVAVPPLPVWVLSAGPNGVINTANTATVLGVDDIGFRVR